MLCHFFSVLTFYKLEKNANKNKNGLKTRLIKIKSRALTLLEIGKFVIAVDKNCGNENSFIW